MAPCRSPATDLSLPTVVNDFETLHPTAAAQGAAIVGEAKLLRATLVPPLEPAAQPVLQGRDLLRRPVGRDDDLLVGVVEGVEGVEELLLRPLLALQELDVVDEQDVGLAVAPLEAAGPLVPDGVVASALDPTPDATSGNERGP